MKIVIHGTKGGYHIFTPERVSGLIDARPDFNKVAAIGQQAYSINFNNNVVILSKYRIIRDVIGEKRTGNIAFSVVIPNDKRLPGADIKNLLDQLSDEYCTKYNITESDNLDNVREDWSFLDKYIKEYEDRLQDVLSDNIENFQQGKGEAAFVYYSQKEELERYFDDLFWDEYKLFKQIFFVSSFLEDKAENPLNALRYNPSSNLTGEIDLENFKTNLRFNEKTKNGIKIEVWVNEIQKSNNSKIRRKDTLEIVYSKLYHENKTATVNWNQIEQRFIIPEEVDLPAIIKPIHFELKDTKLLPIFDTKVIATNNNTGVIKIAFGNKINFESKEIGDTWTVECKNENYFAEPKVITPEKESDKIDLILKKHKSLDFNVSYKGKMIHDYSIKINNKRKEVYNKKIEFTEDEIDKPLTIRVTHEKYKPEEVTFRPKDYTKSLDIEFKEVRVSRESNLTDPETIVKDYPFFIKPKLFIYALIGIFLILILYIVYSLTRSNQEMQVKSSEEDIINYCEGNELKEQILNDYKYATCDLELISNTNSNRIFISKILGLKSKQEKIEANTPNICQKIDSAIAIRTAINLGNLYELQSKQYSTSQRSFKVAVNQIDERFIHTIGATMKDIVSTMSLTDVATFISKLQNLLKIDIDGLQSDIDCNEKIKEIESWKLPPIAIVDSIKNQINNKKVSLNQSEKKHKSNGNGSASPIKNIPSPPVSPPIETKPNPPIINKSMLKTEFWNLVNGGNVKKEVYDSLIKKYSGNKKNLTQEEMDILNYLKLICDTSISFAKFKNIPEMDRLSATTLSKIDINKK